MFAIVADLLPRARLQRRVPRRSFPLASDLGASRGRCNLQDPDFLVWFYPLTCGGLGLCSCRLQTAGCPSRCTLRCKSPLLCVSVAPTSQCHPCLALPAPYEAQNPSLGSTPAGACCCMAPAWPPMPLILWHKGSPTATNPAETEMSHLRYRKGQYRLQKLATWSLAMSQRTPSCGHRRAGRRSVGCRSQNTRLAGAECRGRKPDWAVLMNEAKQRKNPMSGGDP